MVEAFITSRLDSGNMLYYGSTTICCIAYSRSRTLPLGLWLLALGDATTCRRFHASCTGFQRDNPLSSRSPSWSTGRCLGTLQATWLTTAASSPTLAQEDCTRGWHLNDSRQSDAHQIRWQSLYCSWTSSLELSADGPQTAGHVIRRSQTVAEDILFSQWDQHAAWIPFNCAVKILLLIYLLIYLLTYWIQLTKTIKDSFSYVCMRRPSRSADAVITD